MGLSDEFLHGGTERGGQIGLGLHKGGAEPRLQSEEVGGDQDLTIATRSAPDSNGWDVQIIAYLFRKFRLKQFQDEGTATRPLEGVGVIHQRHGFGLGFPLAMIPSLLSDMLGQHPQMSDHFNSTRGKVVDDFREGALQFNGIGARLHELPCAHKRLIGSVIGVRWEIDGHWGSRNTPANSLEVVDHLPQCHLDRILLTQNYHSKGVSHQNQINSRFVEETGGGVVVGGQPSLLTSLLFGGYKRFFKILNHLISN